MHAQKGKGLRDEIRSMKASLQLRQGKPISGVPGRRQGDWSGANSRRNIASRLVAMKTGECMECKRCSECT